MTRGTLRCFRRSGQASAAPSGECVTATLMIHLMQYADYELT